MERAAHDWLVDVYVAIPDFEVVPAFRIRANPCLVLNVRSLAAEIGEGYKVAGLAALALGVTHLFHGVHLPARLKFSTVYNTTFQLARYVQARF